jgi:hypothetical protein
MGRPNISLQLWYWRPEGQPALSEKALVSSKVISDTNVRYIIVMGKLFSSQVILANLYGPNWDDAQLFSDLIATLPDLNSHHLMLGGDFNCLLNPSLDRSRRKPNNVISKSGAVINSFLGAIPLLNSTPFFLQSTTHTLGWTFSCWTIEFFLCN